MFLYLFEDILKHYLGNIMTATHTIAAPAVSTITFAQAKALFEGQVHTAPCFGQRNHLGHMARGRIHVSAVPQAPTTQAVLHAARYVGAVGKSTELIDGYHRLQHWMTSKDGCPFKHLVLITHTVHADTDAEKAYLTDELARTLDNRKAVKTNADRWFGAVREAGISPKSKAYGFGTDMNAYLRETIGVANSQMPHLAGAVRKNRQAHLLMDELFTFAENHIPAASRRKIFHAGVAMAVFTLLTKEKTKRASIVKTLRSALLLAGSGYDWATPPKAVALIAGELSRLASDKVHTSLMDLCANRTEFYKLVAVKLEKPLNKMVKEIL